MIEVLTSKKQPRERSEHLTIRPHKAPINTENKSIKKAVWPHKNSEQSAPLPEAQGKTVTTTIAAKTHSRAISRRSYLPIEDICAN